MILTRSGAQLNSRYPVCWMQRWMWCTIMVNPFAAYDHVKPVFGSSEEPITPATFDHKEGYEYENLPQGIEAIKNEIESIITQRIEIETGIHYLKHKRKSGVRYSGMTSDMIQLYRSCNVPTVNRLRRMGALDPVWRPFGFDPVKSGTGSLKPVTRQSFNVEDLPENGRNFRHTLKNPITNRAGRDYHAADSPSSLSEGLLGHSDSHESTPHISTEGAQLRYEPLEPAQVEKSSRTPTVLEALLEEKRIHRGDLKIPDSIMALWDGDEYEPGKGLTISQKIEMWNKLQNQVLEFASSETVPDAQEAVFQLEFLRHFCFLVDYIAAYGLIPSSDRIKSFKPETIAKMAELHTELLFRQLGKKFYEDRTSVIPELEFWESGEHVQQFHGFIAALSAEDRGHVIHVVLRTILSHTPEQLNAEALPSERFKQLRQGFQRADFLQDARSLSSALADEQAIKQLENPDHLQLVNFVKDLLYFFEEPEMGTEKKQRRLEFQLVYYMIEFLDKFYHPIIETIGKQIENQLPRARKDPKAYLLCDQLNYMRVYLKTWRETARDRSYTGSMTWRDMEPFKKILRGEGGNSYLFNRWIHTFTTEIFEHRNWLDTTGSRYERFDNWMNRIYGRR
ncbi:hypothetical protein KEM48_006259 [Puccinia striiformis f. sp. tritici PST-130]|nr:hypothetical protein KEM48_006259 [Puccinia striiformis f. sp. tritici PST-130]